MLVISKYGLEVRRFDSCSNNWRNSEIRQWINNDFYNKAFNEKEKKLIIGPSILESLLGLGDKIFLLTEEEAKKYFAMDESRKCKATEYAVKNGAYKNDEGYTNWWLRSPTLWLISVYYIDNVGKISYNKVDNDNYAVRPAMWIKI